jgi:hypothetical protein
MARGKSSSGLKGALICTAHVCIYTISVCVMMQTSDLFVIASVFIPHWIIDRWSLGEKWLKLIRGRTIQQIVKMEGGLERDFAAAFYAVVYTVVDNTFHLLVYLGNNQVSDDINHPPNGKPVLAGFLFVDVRRLQNRGRTPLLASRGVRPQ